MDKGLNSTNVTLASDDDGNVILSIEVRFLECFDETWHEMKVKWSKGRDERKVGLGRRLRWDEGSVELSAKSVMINWMVMMIFRYLS